jgi:hypothetical protein
MNAGWQPDEYLESAVRDVLTADDARVDGCVGYSALLMASAGAAGEADRLVTQWHGLTQRPLSLLTADPVHARAWTMLFASSGRRPEWAAAMTPLDFQAEERAHAAYLRRNAPAGLLGGSAAAKIVSGLAEKLDSARRSDALRLAAAEVEAKAREGDLDGAHEAMGTWAELARTRTRPDAAALAACRHVAPLLVGGADPLDLGTEWARCCAGDLIAALHLRYPASTGARNWPELIAAVMRLRADGARLPRPAAAEALVKAERRLGTRLPDDYREFLLTCDGLPPDAVFPRLLGAAELVPADGGVVVIGEPSEDGIVMLSAAGDDWLAAEWSPVLGTTTHRSFRHLLEDHLRLLEQAR